MEITIKSTRKIVHLNGVPARIWEGESKSGIPLHCYITRIAVNKDVDTTQFEEELEQHSPPSKEVEAIPLRMII